MSDGISYSLSLVATDSLPSQEGRKGRPRKHGRVRVSLESFAIPSVQHAMAAGIVRRCQELLGGFFNQKPTEVALYSHESTGEVLSFIVKGTDANTVRTMKLDTEILDTP